ncbi:MAG: helix-turn-helix transcriptional regulator [Clostridium sp.]|nr:helix-turn-helix transcriptional regulator [Clostridium sp.]
MHHNLKTEMNRKNIKRRDMAEFLGVRLATLCDKLNGRYSFKINEAFKIQQRYFPELTIEYLFQSSMNNEEEIIKN